MLYNPTYSPIKRDHRYVEKKIEKVLCRQTLYIPIFFFITVKYLYICTQKHKAKDFYDAVISI